MGVTNHLLSGMILQADPGSFTEVSGHHQGLQRSQLTDAMVEMGAELLVDAKKTPSGWMVLIPYPVSLTPIGMKCLCPL